MIIEHKPTIVLVTLIISTVMLLLLFLLQHAFLYSGEIANGIYIKQIPFKFEYNIISSNGKVLVEEMESAHGWMVVDQYIYGLIWNCEMNANYAGGFHSLDTGFSIFGATLSLPGETRLDGGQEWSVTTGAWSLTGGVEASFTPTLRLQESEYTQPLTIQGARPRIDDAAGMSLYISHTVLRWLEEKSQ